MNHLHEQSTPTRETYIMRIPQTFVTIVISLFIFLSCTTDNNPNFTLTTSSDPRESGVITPSEGSFIDGSEVEVSATANENMVFSGWRGDFMGSDNPSLITMNSNKTIIAFFIDREYPLNILVEGEGAVTERVLQEKSTDFAYGTFVELTATPAEGWRLVEWQGDLSGSENPGVIKMDKAREVTAVFEKREYPLTISIKGEGSVEERVIQQKTTDYQHGTHVALTAHPADGWVFSGWDSDLSGNENPSSIIIDQEAGVTAIFKPVDEILAFTVQGEGTVDIEQVESDENLSKNRVQLTARPFDGWKFNEWQGDVTGSDNPVQVTLIENIAVNAVFEIKEYPLTILTNGEGTVAERVVQQKTTDYEEGTIVELTANPAQGWEFIGWQGNLSGSENPKQISVDGPKEVTAVFAKIPEVITYNLAINRQGQGTVNINPAQGEYETGTLVVLTASPSAGWKFVEWTGDLNSTLTSVEISMNSDKNVTAVFAEVVAPSEEPEEITYKLAVNIQGGGTVNINPDQDEYASGTIVGLTATPSNGWKFIEWRGDLTGSENPKQITINSSKEVTAVFAEVVVPAEEPEVITYNLAVEIQGEGSVNINPEQDDYASGTLVALTATPTDGWEFVEWSGDLSSTQTSVEITIDSNKEITAVFAEVPEEIVYNLAVNIQGGGSVNINPEQDEYATGTLVELTASPTDGWEFDQWEGDLSGTENPTSITMESSVEITAVFIEEEPAFTGGDGSSGNPYQISTVEQLQSISEFIDSHFIQINNINASSTSGWNGGQGFNPIGSSSNPFTGSFNGNGFEISGLTIARNGDESVGLFGFTGSAQIMNTGLLNVNILGKTIVGGLAGTNNGEISNSYVTGNVSGDGIVGGLVANNNGQITNSHSEAAVVGNDEHIGGLVGSNSGEINKAYATGSVTGDESVGGLVGSNRNNARIINSYASGSVSGEDVVGGLAGRNWPNGVIATSYARGNVSGDDELGGFIGWNQASLDSCYWDTEGTSQSNGIGEGEQNGLTGLNTSEMTDSAAESNMSGFDWVQIWQTVPNNYPVLQ